MTIDNISQEALERYAKGVEKIMKEVLEEIIKDYPDFKKELLK